MHCSLLLQLMRNTGLGHLIAASSPSSNGRVTVNVRDLLVGTILAMDMGIHGEWMVRFKKPAETSSEMNKLLVCQALLKCADISNPVRQILTVYLTLTESYRGRLDPTESPKHGQRLLCMSGLSKPHWSDLLPSKFLSLRTFLLLVRYLFVPPSTNHPPRRKLDGVLVIRFRLCLPQMSKLRSIKRKGNSSSSILSPRRCSAWCAVTFQRCESSLIDASKTRPCGSSVSMN